MKVFRYEVIDKDKRQGFLTALDDYFDTDDILRLCWFFEDKLPSPDVNMKNTVSYFTEKGNRTFNKAIKQAKKAFIDKGLEFICLIDDISSDKVIYQDKYQVIIEV